MTLKVVTKTCNNHKRPQTTTINHKPSANDHERPQTTNQGNLTTSKRPQTATPVYQTENLTFRFFFLDGPGNYKEHTNFEKQYGASSKLWRGGLQIVKWGPTKVSSSNKPGGGGS